MSKDFTNGYGPEEYMNLKALSGEYEIKANYFGSRTAKLTGTVTLQVDIYTNWGRPNQSQKTVTLRLNDQKELVEIGKIQF